MIADNPPKKNDVFICHAKDDAGVALAICSFLEKRGLRCWEASRDIQPGRDYAASIISAIQSSEMMVVILSEKANRSNHVRIEVERAFKNDITILPFRIEEIQPEQALEYYLGAYQWLDALGGAPENYFNTLAQTCAALLGREIKTDPPKTDEAPQPAPLIPVIPSPVKPADEEKPAPPAPAPIIPAGEKSVPQPPAPEKIPVAENKPVIKPQPAPTPAPPQPVVPQNTIPPSPTPPAHPQPKPQPKRSNTVAITLGFVFGGIAVLIAIFFIYKTGIQKHTIWFKNNSLTPVFIELNGTLTKIELGDSVAFRAKNKYRIQTKASTYVLRDDGNVLGQNIEWHIDTVVNSSHDFTYRLGVGTDFFLLQMTNNSPQKLVYLKVTSNQQADYSYESNVTVPNDGRLYNLGYYRSFSDITVLTKNGSGQAWEWDCGRDFSYPNTWRQSVKLKKN